MSLKTTIFQDQNAGKLFADEAAAVYERSITSLLKSNMLLYFAYADFEEVRFCAGFTADQRPTICVQKYDSCAIYFTESDEVRESAQHLQALDRRT